MYDIQLNESFSLSSSNALKSHWWGGEPVQLIIIIIIIIIF